MKGKGTGRESHVIMKVCVDMCRNSKFMMLLECIFECIVNNQMKCCWQRNAPLMPYNVGFEEDGFLKALKIKPEDIEPLADNCTKVGHSSYMHIVCYNPDTFTIHLHFTPQPLCFYDHPLSQNLIITSHLSSIPHPATVLFQIHLRP